MVGFHSLHDSRRYTQRSAMPGPLTAHTQRQKARCTAMMIRPYKPRDSSRAADCSILSYLIASEGHVTVGTEQVIVLYERRLAAKSWVRCGALARTCCRGPRCPIFVLTRAACVPGVTLPRFRKTALFSRPREPLCARPPRTILSHRQQLSPTARPVPPAPPLSTPPLLLPVRHLSSSRRPRRHANGLC
jgi:hypothetical protein